MLETKFSREEANTMCQILKAHGTDCATVIEILKLAYDAYPNDAMNTYKHVRLLKELGVIQDRDLLCHTCVHEAVELHAETCKEHKRRTKEKYFFPCSHKNDHYGMNKCEAAVWMVDACKIYRLEHEAAMTDWNEGRRENISSSFEERNGKEVRVNRFNHTGRTLWLEKMFPDILEEIRFNLWMGLLCEKHIGSMKPYADKIIGYR